MTTALNDSDDKWLSITRYVREQEFKSNKELESTLLNLITKGELKKASPKQRLDIAQSVMYEVWEEPDRKRRNKLTNIALAISADCADAYNQMAEDTRVRGKQRAILEKAVKAGERALGKEFFEINAGHFWGMTETRPYMRARAGLAQCLWDCGEHDAALSHYQDMLRLNPGDNQGIRYIMLARLAELGRYTELERFMNGGRYKNDCGADWLYTKTLVAFTKQGDGRDAETALHQALQGNRHVPDYLIGKKRIPRELPDHITIGGENEAYCYAAEFLAAWKKAPGAIDWLREKAAKKNRVRQ